MCALRKAGRAEPSGVIGAPTLCLIKVSRTPTTETTTFPREELWASITNNSGKLDKTLHGIASDAWQYPWVRLTCTKQLWIPYAKNVACLREQGDGSSELRRLKRTGSLIEYTRAGSGRFHRQTELDFALFRLPAACMHENMN